MIKIDTKMMSLQKRSKRLFFIRFNRSKPSNNAALQKAQCEHRTSTIKAQNEPCWYPITYYLLPITYYLLPITI
jgi:hypothetical protein